MSIEQIQSRQRLIQGLRNWADWLEVDSTRPVPVDVHIGTRLPDPDAVWFFTRVHNLASPRTDHAGRVYTDAVFGPVVHRIYAAGSQR